MTPAEGHDPQGTLGGLARDPRLHLSFSGSNGSVRSRLAPVVVILELSERNRVTGIITYFSID
jgi:hypothetical protein